MDSYFPPGLDWKVKGITQGCQTPSLFLSQSSCAFNRSPACKHLAGEVFDILCLKQLLKALESCQKNKRSPRWQYQMMLHRDGPGLEPEWCSGQCGIEMLLYQPKQWPRHYQTLYMCRGKLLKKSDRKVKMVSSLQFRCSVDWGKYHQNTSRVLKSNTVSKIPNSDITNVNWQIRHVKQKFEEHRSLPKTQICLNISVAENWPRKWMGCKKTCFSAKGTGWLPVEVSQIMHYMKQLINISSIWGSQIEEFDIIF